MAKAIMEVNNKLLLRIDGNGQFVDRKEITERVFKLVKEQMDEDIPINLTATSRSLGVDRGLVTAAVCKYKWDRMFKSERAFRHSVTLEKINQSSFKHLGPLRRLPKESVILFFDNFKKELCTLTTSREDTILLKRLVAGFVNGDVRVKEDLPIEEESNVEKLISENKKLKECVEKLSLELNAARIQIDTLTKTTIQGAPIIRNIFLD